MFYHSSRKVNVALTPSLKGGRIRKIRSSSSSSVTQWANLQIVWEMLGPCLKKQEVHHRYDSWQQFGVGAKMLQAVSDDFCGLTDTSCGMERVVHTELKQGLLWGCTMQPRGAWRNTLGWLHFDIELIIGAMFGDPLLSDLSSFVTMFSCTAPQLERCTLITSPDHLLPEASFSQLLSGSSISQRHTIPCLCFTPYILFYFSYGPKSLILELKMTMNLYLDSVLWGVRSYGNPDAPTKRMNLVDFSYQVFQSA